MFLARKIALSSLLALALASGLAGCGRNMTPEEHIAKAKEQIGKGELRAASIELSNAVEKNPKSVEGRWLRAKVALDMGDGSTAEKEARKAVELGFSKAEAQPLLAKALLEQGDPDKALKETEKIVDLPTAKNKATILALRGQAFIIKNQLDLAKTTLAQALEVDPESATAMLGMTALHGYQRQFDEARSWVGKALKVSPKFPEAWSALGDIEMAQGQLAKAAEAFGNAIKYRPMATVDNAKRALINMRLSKLAEAEKDMETLKQQGLGKHPYVSYVQGRILFSQRKFSQAAEAFEISRSANPNDGMNRLYLAMSYQQLGQGEKALSLAKGLAADAPGSLTAKRLLAGVHYSRLEYDAAKDILHTALKASPKDTNALGMLTTIAMMEGETAKALEYAGRLVLLQPNSEQAKKQFMLAKLLAGQAPVPSQGGAVSGDTYSSEFLVALDALRGKQPLKALELAKKLHAQHPNKIDPINLMAACYLHTGQADLARTELEKALKLVPGEPTATRNLAKLEAMRGNTKRARELLQPHVKARPGDEEAVLLLVDVETRLGNPVAVMPLLEQAMQKNPDANDVRARLALKNLSEGRPQKVVELTQGLSEAQLARHPMLIELRGKAFLQIGDAISARKSFEQWARLAPKSAPAHYYLGDSLSRSGNDTMARQQLEQALKLDPRYLPARTSEIKLLAEAKDLSKARNALVKLRQDFGDLPDVLGMEGWFALGTGDYGKAEKSLAQALAKKKDTDFALLLVRAQWMQNKHDQAFKFMQNWLKDRPGDLGMLMHLAGAYLGLNKEEDARSTYETIVARYPNHVMALNNLAWLSREKDMKKAIEYGERAYQLAPKDPNVLDTLGMLNLKRGDTTRAISLLQEAASRSADAQIHLHLGSVLVQQQKAKEARKVLEPIVSKLPGSAAAKEAKALLDTLPASR